MQRRHYLLKDKFKTQAEIRLAPLRLFAPLRLRARFNLSQRRRGAKSLSLILILLCLAATLAFARLSSASVALRVDEAATRMALRGGQGEVSLAVENPSAQGFVARVACELLDTEDRVRASLERDEWITPGGASISLKLAPALDLANQEELKKFLWYRLRYRVIPHQSSGAFVGPAEGIVSLSEITPDFFELRVSTPYYARAGASYHARVRAVHPISAHAVAGVNVSASITFDEDSATVKASGVTGQDGYAKVVFDLPRKVGSNGAELEISAQLGDFTRTAENWIYFDREARVMISTDKPLYQPGQTLHMRALIFNAGKRAIADAPLKLSVFDIEDSLLFRAQLVTSRFGVASADWPIPENTRLGDYRVTIEMEGERFGDSGDSKWIKVSRYDLPNFAVNTKADRDYYLPGQNAEVKIGASYLFGQPVKRGQVRVVRETERTWNYKQQKWETEEGEEYEGETDAAGEFTARVDLAEEHQSLDDSGGAKFKDLTYAAYFTDPTTNRTEQKRFDLRVTKDAIHLYVIKDNQYQTGGFPTQFYVSASYADGTPAACEVTIREDEEESSLWPNRRRSGFRLAAHGGATLQRRVQANRFGVAKVNDLTLLGLKEDKSNVSLKLQARDKKGLTGNWSENFEHSDKPLVRVVTEKSLYRAGESVQATITASKPEMTVIVDVARGWRVIRSEIVRLHQGQALFTVPYDATFKGAVSIIAYYDEENDSGNSKQRAARTVLYPNDEDLKLEVSLDRKEYRPGEEAHAEFQVRGADGRTVESALGVMVFDRAVEERARTDSEFGANASYGFHFNRDGGAVAGLRIQDFERVDRTRPLPAGMELVAEVLLSHADLYFPRVFGGQQYQRDQREIFKDLITEQLNPVATALETRYGAKRDYPSNEQSLLEVLAEQEVYFSQQRDPWGTAYKSEFGWYGDGDVTDIVSAGADKRFETADDFVALRVSRPYFRTAGELIQRAMENYKKRTGSFVRDTARLKNELRQMGVEFDSLRDKRGKPYTLEIGATGSHLTVSVKSADITGSYDPRGIYVPPAFTVWTIAVDYFADTRQRVNDALTENLRLTRRAPQSEAEILEAIRQAGVTEDELRDAWGHPYYIGYKSWVRNTDLVSITHRARYGEALKQHLSHTPVSRQFYYLTLRSAGKDGRAGTWDDFTVGAFYRSTSELDFLEGNPLQPLAARVLAPATQTANGNGNLQGLVRDVNDAMVVGASVRVINLETGIVRETTTNDEGFYRVTNLIPGHSYLVEIGAAGFSQTIVERVPVFAWMENTLDVQLHVALARTTVEVMGGAPQYLSTQTQTFVSGRQLTQLPFNGNIDNLSLLSPGIVIVTKSGVEISANGNRGRSNNFQIEGQDNNDNRMSKAQISTPRLREYFPETLVWQPTLETDAEGRARLSFNLADNITTWKMSVIGSTVDGEIGVAEREIRAFQPFFIEHDPPRVLTEGDQIQLPIVLRNYLKGPQSVAVEIKPESWFTMLGPVEQTEKVEAGDAARAFFNFRATASVKDGKQRITARSVDASDAIEKPVSVHPDGEEATHTASYLMNEVESFDVNFPTDAINNSTAAELKLYPNLMAHVIEGIEGIMKRPYGCGEQTISSTYPSLLALRAYKQSGSSSPVSEKAQRYLRLGYERLLNYRAEGGGFTYWGRGDADLALTAYAFRFLNDAREFTTVDETVITETREWLMKKQHGNGSWARNYSGATASEDAEDALLTAYITRVLATSERGAAEAGGAEGLKVNPKSASLTRALDYLQPHAEKLDEPYLIAAYALASMEANDARRATRAVTRLRALAQKEEGEKSFWSSETGTPFHGWGLTGRIETTALAVQALTRFAALENSAGQTARAGEQATAQELTAVQLAQRGLLYLLARKDAYGVWYSTQATVNVHDALIYAMTQSQSGAGQQAEDRAEIFVNERAVTSVLLPPAGQLSAPVTVDLSSYLSPGSNRVSLRRPQGSMPVALQLVQTYYVPWNSPHASTAKVNSASRRLHLIVSYDKTEAQIASEITCRVEAGRTGAVGGYGMMLAEIGLPPGADVDRASLEKAMTESGWSLSRYDILPDRLIVYLWPGSGGTRFEFKFRPRYGLAAQTAPSVLYDYYNPEARTVIAPTKFIVR